MARFSTFVEKSFQKMETKNRIAVLIDGDNADPSLVEAILSEASKIGKITIKRVYGDWTKINMSKWKTKINENAIRPMQKFSYTAGKNSTDSALVIDAMDILYQKNVEGFCIVSSDSDYTGIAHRIREEGMFIMGIGRKDTPVALVKACECFVYTEILKKCETDETPNKMAETEIFSPEVPKLYGPKVVGYIDLSKFQSKITKKPINPELIEQAYRMVSDDMGYALASRLREALKKLDSSFDPRNYGFTNFRKFLEALVPPYKIKMHKDKSTISLYKENGTL